MAEHGGQRAGRSEPPASGSELDLDLRGALPCLNCGYELQGLSVRGQCPECGLAIRATILHRVDPKAEAFRPMPTPRLTAEAVFLWPALGLVAAMGGWLARAGDAAEQWIGAGALPAGWVGLATVIAAGISGLAAIALVYPVAQTPRRAVLAAGLGALAYIPLVLSLWWIQMKIDPARPAPYFEAAASPPRLMWRLGLDGSLLVILLGLRPNARALVARSLVLRTGRVDRQTIYATAAAVGIAAAGDLIRLVSTTLTPAQGQLIEGAGTLLVLVGSILLTMALAGATVDGWRVRRAIRTPSPTLEQLFRVGSG